MIQANELRIGNYVSDIHASDKFLAKVVELKKNRCYYGSFHCGYNDLKPIPLTPEILEKCGCYLPENILGRWSFLNGYYRFPFITNSLIIKIENGKIFICQYHETFAENSYTSELIEVKYLHTFQNAVFTLTGEELNIQL